MIQGGCFAVLDFVLDEVYDVPGMGWWEDIGGFF
jgi:hypothetical protein